MGDGFVVLDDAFQGLPGEVEPIKRRITPLEPGEHAERLDVVIEAAEGGHLTLQFLLASVAEGRMAEVMAESDGFGEVGFQSKRRAAGAGNLRNFPGRGEPA